MQVQAHPGASQVTQWHRFNPWVRKIPLEKEVATHSSILAWEVPWTEEPGRPTVCGVTKELDTT